MMNRFPLFAIPALLSAVGTLVSCKMDDALYLQKDELGAVDKILYAEPQAGSVEVEVYANKDVATRLVEGSEWAHVAQPAFSGDAKVRVDYLYNEGFPRRAILELSTESRRDTVILLQKGLVEEVFDLPQTNVVAYNREGPLEVALDANVDLGGVSERVVYLSGSGWARSVTLSEGKVTLDLEDNPDPDQMRKLNVVLSRTDGWGEQKTLTLRVTQPASGNILGMPVSFAELRAMVPSGRITIADDYNITGYVVSDPESGNVGENAVLEMNYIDYEAEEETAYIESEDGRYGFRLRTASAGDNIFRPNTRVSVILNGASVQKDSDPERYSIYDITSTMVVSSESVSSSDIPVKRMHIGDLTDEDLYTYVSLADCEIPVRKGCLTPINEGYTKLFSSNRVSKFPILVRDIQGGSLYLYTNTTCPYRRTGAPLPNGSGTLSGIVVHEKYRSFVDKDNPDEELCGNIGRYQIRHMRYSDIDLAESFSQSFSALITEYRYLKIPTPNPDRHWVPTYGDNGWFSHSRTSYVHSTYQIHGWPYAEYCYLGPCGSRNTGNVNGFGIRLEDGTDYGAGIEANTNGKGGSVSSMGLCWCNTQWWPSDDDPQAWIIFFSTEGVESDRVSMQLATHNVSQNLRTPRYWKAEWSTHGDMSADWEPIGEYVVPDVGINDHTLVNQSLGFKQMDFPLPLSILGREKVYIRLMPVRNAASSGSDYDTSTIKSGEANAVSYFAIRYNK